MYSIQETSNTYLASHY